MRQSAGQDGCGWLLSLADTASRNRPGHARNLPWGFAIARGFRWFYSDFMLQQLEQFTTCSVAVIGDLMLDCYLYGDVSRISPEAPVPVVRAKSEKVLAGGAANVAANLATLGLAVRVVGLTGQDDARDLLIEALKGSGAVDCGGVVASPNRRTTKKLRVMGAHQQVVRVDHEDIVPCDASVLGQFMQSCLAATEAADIVILSDYGKGALSDDIVRSVIARARQLGKRVVVDPKRKDFAAYRGASILTPNRRELTEATGLPCETDEEAAAAAARASETTGADILLTRSEKGLSYFPVQGEPLHLATVARSVFDVSGAGDTVVAALSAGLAAGFRMVDAMRMANHAAGIVVSKLGAACVTREELAASLSAENASTDVEDGRLLDIEGAMALRWRWAQENLTVGVTNGCFDLIHPGHIALIRRAVESCDRLIVALNSDDSVRRLKGSSRPVQDQHARAGVLGALKGVSAVVIFSDDTPLKTIEALRPDVLVKGADYALRDVVGADLVAAGGGRVILVDLEEEHSTSDIVARIKRGGDGDKKIPKRSNAAASL
jgi:D-beta-D-heptose 7-phosphate kinase/D-beta-D-heptose 1-phosphate adenosyltransferase